MTIKLAADDRRDDRGGDRAAIQPRDRYEQCLRDQEKQSAA